MNPIIVLFFVILISLGTGLDNGIPMRRSEGGFCYKHDSCGPNISKWGGECKIGHLQSPISLPLNDYDARPAALSFNYKYYSDDFWIINNGHTIQVNLRQEPTSSAELTGYGLDSPYIFAQMHFHWNELDQMGSEHAIDNTFFPIELHLVHYNFKYKSFTEAAQSKDSKALAVLGIFLSHENGDKRNNALDIIFSNMPKKMGPQIKINEKINFNSMLPQEGTNFYSYSGSLTTPPCSQVVEWRVLKNVLFFGPNLLEKLSEAEHDEDGNLIGKNVRPLQKLNERKVEYCIIANTKNSTTNSSRRKKEYFTEEKNNSQRCFKSILIWSFLPIVFFV